MEMQFAGFKSKQITVPREDTKSLFANAKPTSALYNTFNILPITCKTVSSCVLLFQKLFIFLQAKRKLVYARFKTSENTAQKHD